MLVLSRKQGEVIFIGDDIKITVLGIDGGKVRMGIEAPRSMRVDREEVRQRVLADLQKDEAPPAELPAELPPEVYRP